VEQEQRHDAADEPTRRGTLDALVISLGNPLRQDDGVGVAILRELARRAAMPEGVQLLDCGSVDVGLISTMQDFQQVIVVDAADFGGQPGDWVCLAPPDVGDCLPGVEVPGSSHAIGLAEALHLGQALGILPQKILFYGIQPASVDWAVGLSQCVQGVVPAICASIERVLSREPENDARKTGSGSVPWSLEPLAGTPGAAHEQ